MVRKARKKPKNGEAKYRKTSTIKILKKERTNFALELQSNRGLVFRFIAHIALAIAFPRYKAQKITLKGLIEQKRVK